MSTGWVLELPGLLFGWRRLREHLVYTLSPIHQFTHQSLLATSTREPCFYPQLQDQVRVSDSLIERTKIGVATPWSSVSRLLPELGWCGRGHGQHQGPRPAVIVPMDAWNVAHKKLDTLRRGLLPGLVLALARLLVLLPATLLPLTPLSGTELGATLCRRDREPGSLAPLPEAAAADVARLRPPLPPVADWPLLLAWLPAGDWE